MKCFFICKKIILITLLAVMFSCNNSDNTGNEQGAKTAGETTVETSNDKEKLKTEKVLYPNGDLKMEGILTNGVKEGKWTSWYEDGMVWSETYFENGIRNGKTTTWYPDGKKRYEGFFKDGKESGKWMYWDEAGNLIKEVEY